MLLFTGRLQRPFARKAIRYAAATSVVPRTRIHYRTFIALSARPHPCFQPSQSAPGGVLGTTTRKFIPKLQNNSVRFIHSKDRLPCRAFIALGSNMGDKVALIEQACKEMEATGEVKILRTSSLYETRAMYVLDQDNFVNGACEVNYAAYLLENR
jgi:hypothetical protein